MEWVQEYIQEISTFIATGSTWVYLLVGCAALLESVPLAGIVIPGGIILMLAGFFSHLDGLDFGIMLLVASCGAAFGDLVGYWLGKRYGMTWVQRHERLTKAIYFDKGRQYFMSHGEKSVLLGRFVGPLRPIIPFVAGVFRMPVPTFLFFTVAGGVLWALAFLSFGYFFGESWEIAERWANVLGFAGVVVLVSIVFVVVAWRAIASQRRAVVRITKELGRSISHALRTNEDIRGFAKKHPRITGWVKRRVTATPTGRYLTLGVLVASYFTWHTLAIPLEVVTSGPILQADIHTARMVVQLYDPVLVGFFKAITMMGEVEVIASMALVILALCALWGRWREVVVGLGVLGTTPLCVWLGKKLIARPRPDIAQLVTEDSFSLPSGHAAHAIVLYGWAAYLILLYVKPRKLRIGLATAGVALIPLIGLSRVYLGVHWVSDVLTGYALGASILTLGITAAEIHRRFRIKGMWRSPRIAINRKYWITGCVVTGQLALITIMIVSQSPITPRVLTGPPRVVLTEAQLTPYIVTSLSKTTQTLSGRPQEPISFIFVGTRAQIEESFMHADWRLADPITTKSLRDAASAALLNTSYATAPITPVFYGGHPHDIGVQKETERESVRQRHHARIWHTGVTLDDGREVWVGTASYDIGMKRFITHRIDPAIDIERDYILSELVGANSDLSYDKIQITVSTWGKNFTGDLFFTDGHAYLITWPRGESVQEE